MNNHAISPTQKFAWLETTEVEAFWKGLQVDQVRFELSRSPELCASGVSQALQSHFKCYLLLSTIDSLRFDRFLADSTSLYIFLEIQYRYRFRIPKYFRFRTYLLTFTKTLAIRFHISGKIFFHSVIFFFNLPKLKRSSRDIVTFSLQWVLKFPRLSICNLIFKSGKVSFNWI